jgi:hypothetical protein
MTFSHADTPSCGPAMSPVVSIALILFSLVPVICAADEFDIDRAPID